MPRYFFNVEDDRTIIDQEGTNLPNLRAAREKAVSTSAELLRERAGSTLWNGKPWRMCTKSPHGRTTATSTMPKPTGNSQPPTPASS